MLEVENWYYLIAIIDILLMLNVSTNKSDQTKLYFNNRKPARRVLKFYTNLTFCECLRPAVKRSCHFVGMQEPFNMN